MFADCVSEVSDRIDPALEPLKLSMDIFDYCSLVIFVVEIVLKWLDHFQNFWKNNWNIFDFLVTFLVSNCMIMIIKIIKTLQIFVVNDAIYLVQFMRATV